jgi:4-diphosphocytidyl-2-C-methyl-D-erythritol kinase
VPADARNLAWRAAEAFLARARTPNGVEIRLAKRIPSGAGLGGGSSDAGTVLRGLAALLPGAVPPVALRELALGLGADVPFFLDPRPADVSGIGERIAPVAGLPPLPVLVVHPGVALATKEVYGGYAAGAARSARAGAPAFPHVPGRLTALDADGWRLRVGNDLEPAAVGLCSRIAELREEIREAGALAAAMSGSGSAVFGVYASADRRDRAQAGLRLGPGERAFATETVPSV